MKKIWTLCLTAALIFSAHSAHSIDFKVKGVFLHSFDYVSGGNFMSKDRQGNDVYGQQWAAVHQQRDSFEVNQRVNLQIEAIASEFLSGTVHFELGDWRYGYSKEGGALGTDGNVVHIKHAYIDWIVPNTELRFRMGLQPVKLPGFAVDNPVLVDDMAGITASYKFNDNVALTALWYRIYNDNWTKEAPSAAWTGVANDSDNAFDNFDIFGLIAPVQFSGFKITPWAVVGALGPNSMSLAVNGTNLAFENNNTVRGISANQIKHGLFPAAFSSARPTSSLYPDEYSTVYWAGVTADMTFNTPFRFTVDAIYGGVDTGHSYFDRKGWFGMVVGEYKMDWGVPGIYAWYFSGDDSDVSNGSERLPYLSTTNSWSNALSTFGYRGSIGVAGGKGVLGTNPNATWGVGFRVKNMSFIEDISHIFRINYFGGTNATGMADYITGRKTTVNGEQVYRSYTDFNSFGTYLTTADTGIEVNFDTKWQIYENLSANLELGYIHLWLDSDVWGKYGNGTNNSLHYKDAWKATVNLIYKF